MNNQKRTVCNGSKPECLVKKGGDHLSLEGEWEFDNEQGKDSACYIAQVKGTIGKKFIMSSMKIVKNTTT